MSAETIRAALEAAHIARIENRRTRTRRMLKNGVEREPGEDGRADTAAAIVAFLRALPQVRITDDAGTLLASASWEPIAAAVEAEARDG
jgi:hypothetical protein